MHELLIFKNKQLRQRALTHRSYVNEHPDGNGHNERLEFLGDAILTYLSGDYLYQQHPEMSEGEMTRHRSALVDKKQLARFAIEIGLPSEMRVGEGMISQTQSERLLSSTFEAVVGAYYLDNNRDIEVLRPLVERLFKNVPESIFIARSGKDPKSQFQEYVQTKGVGVLPKYVTERVGGVDHAPEHVSKVYVDDEFYGEGRDRNKKAAEREAAKDALASLRERGLL